MELNSVIDQFKLNAKIISLLVQNTSEEQMQWKPDGKWSMLEVINHLYDEEREDFRERLSSTLADPGREWMPLDPESAVTERNYNLRNIDKSLENFLSEREASIKWLLNLSNPPWINVHNHPKLGPMSASSLLYNWLAHDYLHIRQLTKLKYMFLKKDVTPIALDYAGNW